jgi:hypothetical protein
MTTLPLTEETQRKLAEARRLETMAKERRRYNDPREAGELEHRARELRRQAGEAHNARLASELERAKSEPINLSDLIASHEELAQ